MSGKECSMKRNGENNDIYTLWNICKVETSYYEDNYSAHNCLDYYKNKDSDSFTCVSLRNRIYTERQKLINCIKINYYMNVAIYKLL